MTPRSTAPEAAAAGAATAASGADALVDLMSAPDSAGAASQRTTAHPRVRRLGPLGELILVAVAIGALLAGLLTPLGMLVRTGTEAGYRRFGPLPVSVVPTLPERSELIAADGTRLALFFQQNRGSVPDASLPRVLEDAVIAIEDVRFFSHGAIDPRGALRAVVVNATSGADRQGGSTISMQLAKNLRALTAPTVRSQRAAVAETFRRKLHDMRYAAALEQRLSKRQILTFYLNAVYFGDGTYGAQAAAERYFSTSAQHLTLPQAALLAGMIQNPEAYDPVRHPLAARERRNAVLTAMHGSGAISASSAAQAAATKLNLRQTTIRNGCVGTTAAFFCDWARTQLLADPALGRNEKARLRMLEIGGLRIRSTLQPRVQRSAQRALAAAVPPSAPVAAVITMVQPATGGVLAMAVSRPFGTARGATMLNLATGGASGFQVGSTFKPFVLAAALTRRIPLSTRLNCPQRYVSTAFPKHRPFPYPVANAGDSEAGTFTLSTATWESVNTCYLQLSERTGLALPAGTAEALGVRRLPGGRPLHRVPSLTLGTNEASPLAMAGAYAAFAANGRFCSPTAVLAIENQRGAALRHVRPPCRQVLNPGVARTVTTVLRGVIDGPDPHRTGVRASIGRPAAGKTGTTQGYSAAWFIGYTRQIAAAVWLGDPAGGYARPLRKISINGRYYPRVYGGDIPAAIWSAAMRASLQGTPPTALP